MVADKKVLNIAMFGHKHMLSREGGIEIVVSELATRMSQSGHKVVVYDRSTHHISGNTPLDQRREYHGVKIIPVWTVERKGIAALTSSISAAWRASRSSADVVHIHAEGPAAMAFMPKISGKKVIVTVHGIDWQREKWGGFASRYIKFGEKQAVKWADEIIVLSRGAQEYFKSTYSKETVFIPNGVRRPDIVPAKLFTVKWGLKKDNYFIFLGRIVPEKGLRYLVKAWKGVRTDKKLVIAGGSSDTQSFLSELQQMANGNDSVIFTGFQQGRVLEELYSNSYVYCLPSDLEGMPLSLLEAMSYGNCCVVSDIPECAEIVEGRAIVFKKSDVEDLRGKLQFTCDHPEEVQKLRNGVADFICEKYSWDDTVERTLELYRKGR